MKEQIEEMARDICHLGVPCDECTMLARQMGQSKEQYCKAMQYAKRAYEKGYRKQSDGEWVANRHISVSKRNRTIHYETYKCSVCGTWNGRHKTTYCPNCGAKMKGGAENDI